VAAPRATTPVLVKAVAASVLLLVAAWWLMQMRTLHANEARLSAISSQIAGRQVKVDCPGPLSRMSDWDTMEGTADIERGVSHLRPHACAEADALARGKRAEALGCAERGNDCPESLRLAVAMDVVAHEAWHLSYIYDEAETECRAVQTLGRTAQQLGATEVQGRALARIYWQNHFPLMPRRYRSDQCYDGGRLDMRRDDASWPS
jgi:hypothetical protein